MLDTSQPLAGSIYQYSKGQTTQTFRVIVYHALAGQVTAAEFRSSALLSGFM